MESHVSMLIFGLISWKWAWRFYHMFSADRCGGLCAFEKLGVARKFVEVWGLYVNCWRWHQRKVIHCNKSPEDLLFKLEMYLDLADHAR